MRTTVQIDDDLLRAVRKRAAETGSSVSRLVGLALRAWIGAPRRRAKRPFRLGWKPVRGTSLPTVDVADRGALYDVLDDRA